MSDALTPGVATGDRPNLATGDATTAFARLFDTHATALHCYLARRVGSETAHDLVAETFFTALAHRGDYQPRRATARAWLYGIATNLLRHHYRDEQRLLAAVARAGAAERPHTDGADHGVAERVDALARVRGLADALTELAAADRDVLLLTSWAGLDSVEVAEALGVPVGTVRSRLHRARRRLRAAAPAHTEKGGSNAGHLE